MYPAFVSCRWSQVEVAYLLARLDQHLGRVSRGRALGVAAVAQLRRPPQVSVQDGCVVRCCRRSWDFMENVIYYIYLHYTYIHDIFIYTHGYYLVDVMIHDSICNLYMIVGMG